MIKGFAPADLGHAVIASFDGDPARDWARDLAALSREGQFSVWSLGADPECMQRLAPMLPAEAQIGKNAPPLETFADAAEDDLLDLYSQLDAVVKDRLAWDVSLLSDLSPYAGHLQLNVSRYLQMDQIVRGGGRHLFLVDDDGLGQALARVATANGLTARWAGASYHPGYVLGGLRARVSALKMLWQHKRAAKKLLNGKSERWDALKNCDVLIMDWAAPTTFSADKATEFVSNLERMPQIFRNAGLKTGYIANPLYWLYPFSDIAKNSIGAHDPVVMVDECLSLASTIKGAWKTWRLRTVVNGPVLCAGHDITALIGLESLRDVSRTQPSRSYAYTDIARTLAENGVYPKSIVYPFENQGWERAFIAGARKYLPDCRLAAYQHCPFSSRMISFFPAKPDLRAAIADQLIVMGPYYAQQYEQHGIPKDKLVVGGSLRFEKQASQAAPPRGEREAGAPVSVLCCTSIEYAESVNLVLKAARAVQGVKDAHMVVNFHPKVDKEFIDKVHGALGQFDAGADRYVSFSTQPATELLKTADVLLYNHSGAAFDALLLGGAAVFVSVDGALNYDKIPDSISRRVQTSDQLKEMLNVFLSEGHLTNQSVDRSVGGCIAPVDEKVIVNAVTGT